MATTAVIGSTGLVGSYILSTLLATEAFTGVYTISRRPPKTPTETAKLHAVVEPETSNWAGKLTSLVVPDAVAPRVVFSALGTTRAAAGGLANQWKIDHDLNVELIKAAAAAGTATHTYVFISAKRSAMFADRVPYTQMKTGVEEALRTAGFAQAIVLRPAVLIGEREEARMVDRVVNMGFSAISAVLGAGAKESLAVDANVVARAAVHAAMLAEQGKAPDKYWVLEQSDIYRLGRDEWREKE